jgi:hypothetical protein
VRQSEVSSDVPPSPTMDNFHMARDVAETWGHRVVLRDKH